MPPSSRTRTDLGNGDGVPLAVRINTAIDKGDPLPISQADVDHEVEKARRFLEELPSRGAVGIAVRDHVVAISVLMDHDHPSVPAIELQNMRRMAMLVLTLHRERVHLPKKLPLVIAVVNLGGKQLCLLSDQKALLLALLMSRSGNMMHAKRATCTLLKRAKAERAHVLFTLSAPYQVGVQNIAWEMRTLHPVHGEGGRVVFKDGMLAFGSTDMELHAASPTVPESLYNMEQHEALVKTFVSNFPVISMDGEVEPRVEPRVATEGRDSLVRHMAADRKKAIEDLRALQVAARQQDKIMREQNEKETALLRAEIERLDLELKHSQQMHEGLIAGAEGACLEHQADAAAAQLELEEDRKQARTAAEAASKRETELKKQQGASDREVARLRKELAKLTAAHEIDVARWEIERKELAKRAETADQEVSTLKLSHGQLKESLCTQVTTGTSRVDALEEQLAVYSCRYSVLVDTFSRTARQDREERQHLKERVAAALRLGPNTFATQRNMLAKIASLREELRVTTIQPPPPLDPPLDPPPHRVRTSEAATSTQDLVDEATRGLLEATGAAIEGREDAMREIALYKEREARRAIPYPADGPAGGHLAWQVQPNGAVYNFALEADIEGVIAGLQRVAEHARSGAVANAQLNHHHHHQQMQHMHPPVHMQQAYVEASPPPMTTTVPQIASMPKANGVLRRSSLPHGNGHHRPG